MMIRTTTRRLGQSRQPCNPNNESYQGYDSHDGGDGTHANRDNHANQMTPQQRRVLLQLRYSR
jgi:hypothetical protein